MKDSIVIVFVHAKLEEVPGGKWSLSAPYFDLNVAVRSKDDNFGIGIGFLFKRGGLHN